MLCLSRKRDENIVLTLPDGRNVTVCVVAIRGNTVQVGVAAPRDVAIVRAELLTDQQRAAARCPTPKGS